MTNADQIGYMKIASGSALLGLIAGLGWWVASIQPVFDDQLCRTDAPLPGHFMVLSDLSEADDSDVVTNMAREWKTALPMYHKFSVYRIGDVTAARDERENVDTWPLIPVFEACNPGSAEQVNALIQGTRVAQKKFDSLFAEPLERAMADAVAQAGAESSPILAAFSKIPEIPGWSDTARRTLMIRSDFLEFTPKFSQYKTVASIDETLDATGTDIPDLAGVDVSIFYVTREKYASFQSAEHAEFWDRYFRRSRASISMLRIDERSVPVLSFGKPEKQSLAAL